MFVDATEMKDAVRAAIKDKPYNVMDFYHTEGRAQKIARHFFFEWVTFAVITVNAIWIAVDIDYNDALVLTDADPMFQVMEHFFCSFFLAEIITRFTAFKYKRHCLMDAWFVFDGCLVSLMVFETWIMSLLAVLSPSSGGGGNMDILSLARLVRLTRMARLARVMRAIPELMILVKGILCATRSVGFTMALLFIIIYIFAILFRQLSTDTEIGRQYFNSVSKSMVSLLLDATLPDFAAMVYDVSAQDTVLGVILMIFIGLSTLTVLNMLVGILVEVVGAVASVEKEQARVYHVRGKIEKMLMDNAHLITTYNGAMSKEEFESLLLLPKAARMINDVGVDVVGLVDLSQFIFKDEQWLTFGDFMELVMQLRGNNSTTQKDIVDMKKYMKQELNMMSDIIVATLMEATTAGGRPSDFFAEEQGRQAMGKKNSVKNMNSATSTRSVTNNIGRSDYVPQIFNQHKVNPRNAVFEAVDPEVVASGTPPTPDSTLVTDLRRRSLTPQLESLDPEDGEQVVFLVNDGSMTKEQAFAIGPKRPSPTLPAFPVLWNGPGSSPSSRGLVSNAGGHTPHAVPNAWTVSGNAAVGANDVSAMHSLPGQLAIPKPVSSPTMPMLVDPEDRDAVDHELACLQARMEERYTVVGDLPFESPASSTR
jgi:hypothetical protein